MAQIAHFRLLMLVVGMVYPFQARRTWIFRLNSLLQEAGSFVSVIWVTNFGHYQTESLNQPMLITALFSSNTTVTGSLITRLVSKPGHAPKAVWTGNIPILLQRVNPLGELMNCLLIQIRAQISQVLIFSSNHVRILLRKNNLVGL